MFNLIHGHVAGPFDHDLATRLPGPSRQLAHDLQFGQLGLVGGVGQAPRPQTVAQAPRHVVRTQNVAQVVETRVEGVLLVVRRHPSGHQRPTPTHNSRNAAGGQRQVLLQQRTMNRHVVDALPRLLLDRVEELLRPHLGNFVKLLGDLVNRHGTHGNVGGLDNPFAHGVDFLAGGEIHDRIGPVFHGGVQFIQLTAGIACHGRFADVGVDLCPRGNANADGPKPLLNVGMTGRDHHAAACDLFAHSLRR